MCLHLMNNNRFESNCCVIFWQDGDDDFLHLLVLGNTVTQQQLAETESDILAMLQYEVPLYSILHFQPVSEYFESSARKVPYLMSWFISD